VSELAAPPPLQEAKYRAVVGDPHWGPSARNPYGVGKVLNVMRASPCQAAAAARSQAGQGAARSRSMAPTTLRPARSSSVAAFHLQPHGLALCLSLHAQAGMRQAEACLAPGPAGHSACRRSPAVSCACPAAARPTPPPPAAGGGGDAGPAGGALAAVARGQFGAAGGGPAAAGSGAGCLAVPVASDRGEHDGEAGE